MDEMRNCCPGALKVLKEQAKTQDNHLDFEQILHIFDGMDLSEEKIDEVIGFMEENGICVDQETGVEDPVEGPGCLIETEEGAFCDEEVSSGMNHTERRKYADILLKYASMQTAPWRNAFGGKKQETEERIRHIMEGKHRERKLLSAFCALVIMSGCMVEASEMTGENTEKNPESAAEVQSEEMQFAQPVRDSEVTCGYGCYAGHYGEDVLSNDSDILAAADGIVSETGFDTKYGNYIILSHTDEYYTFYASLESIACTDKQHVSAGEVIGKMGSTGMSTGTHLHFAIRRIYGNPSDLLTHMAGEIEGDEIYTLFE